MESRRISLIFFSALAFCLLLIKSAERLPYTITSAEFVPLSAEAWFNEASTAAPVFFPLISEMLAEQASSSLSEVALPENPPAENLIELPLEIPAATLALVPATLPEKTIAEPYREVWAIVTAYCPCTRCCGRGAHGRTSIGSTAWAPGIAADPRALPYGTRLDVDGYGTHIIDDTGGAMRRNWRGRGKLHIDVRMKYHYDARAWGKKVMKIKVYD